MNEPPVSYVVADPLDIIGVPAVTNLLNHVQWGVYGGLAPASHQFYPTLGDDPWWTAQLSRGDLVLQLRATRRRSVLTSVVGQWLERTKTFGPERRPMDWVQVADRALRELADGLYPQDEPHYFTRVVTPVQIDIQLTYASSRQSMARAKQQDPVETTPIADVLQEVYVPDALPPLADQYDTWGPGDFRAEIKRVEDWIAALHQNLDVTKRDIQVRERYWQQLQRGFQRALDRQRGVKTS